MSLEKAIRLRKEGQVTASCELLKELVNAQPDSAELQYQCGWSHDVAGLEREAVPYYERALLGKLSEKDMKGAYLGLGSTYRTIGDCDRSKELLLKAKEHFPDETVYDVFLGMTLYHLEEHQEAMRLLLNVISTHQDPSLAEYHQAIGYYANHLEERW